jgi:hypothetical protein
MALQQNEIKIDQIVGRNILEIAINGKLTPEDYDDFVPEIDRMIQNFGKIRILLALPDFHGWTAGGLWEDTKFAVKHYKDIERLAIVGDKKWEEGMAYFCKPFTHAEVKYFDHSRMDEARHWIAAT